MSTVETGSASALIGIGEIEDELIAVIKANISNASIESYPDDPEAYNLTHPAGAILLRYEGETTPTREVDGRDFIIQDREVTFDISIISKSLRKVPAGNVYGYIENLRNALTGFVVTGFDPASLDGFALTNYDDVKKRWQYNASIQFSQVITKEL